MLRLRSVRASSDFDDYWSFHLQQEHQRNNANRYAAGKAPELNHLPACSGNRTSLRLVKTVRRRPKRAAPKSFANPVLPND